jgi:hypothetical protein
MHVLSVIDLRLKKKGWHSAKQNAVTIHHEIFCELFSAASRIRISKPMNEDSTDSSEKSQFGSIPWGRIYTSVLIFTVIVIVSLYFFSQFYSD